MASLGFYAMIIGAIGMSLVTLIINSELEHYMDKCEKQEALIRKLISETKRA